MATSEIIVLIVYLAFYLFVITLSIGSHIIGGIGFYTLAKRREIPAPWLAWIPVANTFIMGALADDYNLKVRNVKTKFRYILTILMAAVLMFAIVLIPLVFIFAYSAEAIYNEVVSIIPYVIITLIYFALMGVALAASVFQYISIYRIYQSCVPKHTLLFFLITIFVSYAFPFFILFLRNSDEGMPQIIQGEN